jgi:hypothetical protein
LVAGYGPSRTAAAVAEAEARRRGGDLADAPVSRPNAQNPPYHAFDDTPADAPQSEPSQEEQPSYNSVADTILGAASSLSDAELRSVIVRLGRLRSGLDVAMSEDDTTPTSDGMGTS